MKVEVARPVELVFRLRIPQWSKRTEVWLNGDRLPDVYPGTYLPIQRTWRSGDTIRVRFDFGLHAWLGSESK